MNKVDKFKEKTMKDYTAWDVNVKIVCIKRKTRQKLRTLFKRKARRNLKKEDNYEVRRNI